MSRSPVTLQINLAPSDFDHARHLLPHQVRVWRDQVEEILLVVDLHRSHGRFSARWEEGLNQIGPLARSITGARVLTVDYSRSVQLDVAKEFLGGRATVPAKDFRGGPYHSYLYALHAANQDWVLHLDSDMMFGGLSAHWLEEAIADQEKDPRVLLSAPHPGPPCGDGRLRSQHAMRTPGRENSHDFDSMSTRLFLMSRSRFRAKVGAIGPRLPSLRSVVKAWVEGNPPEDLPEHLFTLTMRARGLLRREFLGTGPGMWHLHPPYRNEEFLRKLPDLIERCERGEIPEGQRGDHDINDSLVDWSDARATLRANRWWRRLLTRGR